MPVYKCLALLIVKTFNELYGPHLQAHVPHLKASIIGFLGVRVDVTSTRLLVVKYIESYTWKVLTNRNAAVSCLTTLGI